MPRPIFLIRIRRGFWVCVSAKHPSATNLTAHLCNALDVINFVVASLSHPCYKKCEKNFNMKEDISRGRIIMKQTTF
jgi:hypothetical protein